LKKIFSLLLVLFSFAANATEVGPSKGYFMVHDFQDDWVVYDSRLKANVPYVVEQHPSIPSHTLAIDVESNRNYFLLIFSETENFLFINGSLRQKLPAGKWLTMSVDSLYKVYQKPEIALTIFGATGIQTKKVFFGHDKKIVATVGRLTQEKLLIAKPKPTFNMHDGYVMIAIFLVLLFAILANTFNRLLVQFYNPRNLFTFLVREQAFVVNKPFNPMTFVFVIFLSFLISFVVIILHQNGLLFSLGRLILQEGDTTRVVITNYVKISIILIAGMVLKFMLISSVGNVFNVDKTAFVHFFKMIQSSLLFYTILVFIAGTIAISYPSIGFEWSNLIYVGIVFYLLRSLIVYLTIERSIPVKKLYLFSYLCIVEILPILIGVRYLA
jgi:Domain of unknown function (DUF4271)